MPGSELFDDAERKQVEEVMETGILSRYGSTAARKGRWKALEMERAICEVTGSKHALLLSSATAALTVSIAALGVGAGDEVILPTFTFVASFESILAAGATPILVDVDDTLCLSPEAVRNAITPRTKIVMPVHMCGAMARIDELKGICEENDVFLLEDACQAFGASYRGKMLGTFGDAGCYSFDFNKIVTCGEGGAIVTDCKKTYERADMYHDHGHDHKNEDRGLETHPFPGYNFRTNELNAAIGCAQIGKLEKILGLQRRHKKAFKDALGAIEEIRFRHLPDPEGDSATFLSLFLPSEELARKASSSLKERGVEGVFHWYDNNWHYVRKWGHFTSRRFANPISSDILRGMPDYAGVRFDSDELMSRCVSISIRIGWNEEEIDRKSTLAAEAIKSIL